MNKLKFGRRIGLPVKLPNGGFAIYCGGCGEQLLSAATRDLLLERGAKYVYIPAAGPAIYLHDGCKRQSILDKAAERASRR